MSVKDMSDIIDEVFKAEMTYKEIAGKHDVSVFLV